MSDCSFAVDPQPSFSIRLARSEEGFCWVVEDDLGRIQAGGSCQRVAEAAETAAGVLALLERELVA